MRILHGGRQEGVSIVDIDTGAMRILVFPARGMSVLEAVSRRRSDRLEVAGERSGQSVH
jgi:hypothetical protein